MSIWGKRKLISYFGALLLIFAALGWFIWSSLSISTAVAAESNTGSVEGIITYADSGSFASANVNLILQSNPTIKYLTSSSSSDGHYLFENVPTDTYTLQVLDPDSNFQSYEQTVTIEAGVTKRIDVQVQKASAVGSIEGYILSPENSMPITTAEVALISQANSNVITTTNSYQGYKIQNVAAGTYTFRVTAPNFKTHEETVTIVAGETLQKNVTMTARPFKQSRGNPRRSYYS